MYFSDISDKEAVQFHNRVRVNARLEEVLSRGSSEYCCTVVLFG